MTIRLSSSFSELRFRRVGVFVLEVGAVGNEGVVCTVVGVSSVAFGWNLRGFITVGVGVGGGVEWSIVDETSLTTVLDET